MGGFIKVGPPMSSNPTIDPSSPCPVYVDTSSALILPWISAFLWMSLKKPSSRAKYSPYWSSPGAEERLNEEL